MVMQGWSKPQATSKTVHSIYWDADAGPQKDRPRRSAQPAAAHSRATDSVPASLVANAALRFIHTLGQAPLNVTSLLDAASKLSSSILIPLTPLAFPRLGVSLTRTVGCPYLAVWC